MAASVGAQVINALRVGGVQQVQLDVVIAQVARSDFRAMAFNFLADTPLMFFASTVGHAVAEPVRSVWAARSHDQWPVVKMLRGCRTASRPTCCSASCTTTHGFLGFLQALRIEGVGKTLAEPSLATMSGTPGSFLAGGEQAVPIPAGLGQVGVQFEEFGTRLNYLPIVLGNGKIQLEMEPEVSSLSAGQRHEHLRYGGSRPGRPTAPMPPWSWRRAKRSSSPA